MKGLVIGALLVSACLSATVSTGTSAYAAPDAQRGGPVNLVATTAVKRALRASFLRAHRSLSPAQVRGPLRGSVYYARYGAFEWALATFSVPRVGTTDQPEVFRRRRGGAWVDRGDTGGSLCAVPRAVVRLWGLEKVYGYQC